MKEIYYIYNNEAIASCIFLKILTKVDNLDVARSCLILPFLLDDRTVNHLIKVQGQNLNLEELIREQPRLFVSFNKRYLSLLPITINSLMILSKSNQVIIGKEIIKSENISFDTSVLGERFSKIDSIMPDFLNMLKKHQTPQLYRILKIQL